MVSTRSKDVDRSKAATISAASPIRTFSARMNELMHCSIFVGVEVAVPLEVSLAIAWVGSLSLRTN